MEYENFGQLQARIQEHYQRGDYAAALRLATQNAARFPDEAALIYYWRISMCSRLGDLAQALHLLEETVDRGIWYADTLLRRSPSWKPLQGLPDFEQLVERSHTLQAADQTLSYPLLTLRPKGECSAGELPCPLLVGLHGNASTAREGLDFWKEAASKGWLVAAPQSSQSAWKDAYVWDDLEVTRAEIVHHIDLIKRQYSVDPRHTVIAGHSMGGEVAIWLALTGAVDVQGFIAIGPGGPFTDEPGSWLPFIEQAKGHGLAGYFIIGSKDETIPQEGIRTLIEMLTDAGIPCNLEVIAGAEHDFVPEYAAGLMRGLGFLAEDEDSLEDPP